jgi:hypothetical protein
LLSDDKRVVFANKLLPVKWDLFEQTDGPPQTAKGQHGRRQLVGRPR